MRHIDTDGLPMPGPGKSLHAEVAELRRADVARCAHEMAALRRIDRMLGALFLFALGTLALLVVSFLSGCARPLDLAVSAANSAQTVLVEAKPVITDACAPAYEAAESRADLDAVDARCKPAVAAYQTLRASWVLAVAALGAAYADGEATPEVARAVAEVGRGLVAMQAALRGLPAPRERLP